MTQSRLDQPRPNSRFLLLSIRAQDEAADNEYEAVRQFGGLEKSQLHRIRLTHEPLGDITLDDWSGIILGGGPYNVTDPTEAKSATQLRAETEIQALLAEVVPRDFPFLGCCYGIGTLGTYIGAEMDRTHSEPVGGTTIHMTDEGRADPLMEGLPAAFDAFVGHKEAISTLPPHAVRLAYSAACPVQAFRVGNNVYATQFHPELDLPGMLIRIAAYKNHGYFAPEAADTLRDTVRRFDIAYPSRILRQFVKRYG
ncbi:glutamine amidotransferase [Hoyosella subflava]|uniref:Glutamine amidotransferase class-I n=1 Tax=Hoyosella subflava (strain DSM 45089 / JCM 17490 / NBRC 109087 / DQS3-9A1) TaxID=443218 RepID=F6EF68_HOYSD|nr:glutamine amidotransferase [Hoyosella subflava]AEF38647.1 Glutamine amidotransferase class-I [Hoyosella subflava DQS3-9A1]